MPLGTTPLLSNIEAFSPPQVCHRQLDTATTPSPEGLRFELHSTLTATIFAEPMIEYDDRVMERGRSAQRKLRVANPLERAESRCHKDDATVEVIANCIQFRSRRSDNTFVDDPKNICAALEDHLLEPCPHYLMCNSVYEITEMSSTWADTPSLTAGLVRTNLNAFHDLLPTKAAIIQNSATAGCKFLISAPTLPLEAMLKLQPIITDQEYLSLKSLFRSYSDGRPSLSRASRFAQLPAEIMYQIYTNLSPTDFNSARHSCHSWYMSSLERSLLEAMLKRGGWSSSIQPEFVSNHTLGSQIRVNAQLLSKRISQECALGPKWTGNGLYRCDDDLSQHNRLQETPFVHASTTNFTEIGVHYPNIDESESGIYFTVSSCGKYLMVSHGRLVHIYELNRSHKGQDDNAVEESGALRPVTRVLCPRRVLACSMDTSSNRYAIAVLLDGRMGLVCDLTAMSDSSRHPSFFGFQKTQNSSIFRDSEYHNRISISSSRSRDPNRAHIKQPSVFPVIVTEASRSNSPLESKRGPWEDMIHCEALKDPTRYVGECPTRSPLSLSQGQSQAHSTFPATSCSMPLESSDPRLYAPLCSAEDLPRSVALCPQRRCVAFGCSSGIELHWVDALTGQDLNRWFPLTAPSDYLYFLPPRADINSAKKLRLISSAGQPGERPVTADGFGGSGAWSKNTPRSRLSQSWGFSSGRHIAGCDEQADSGILSRDNSDHYRAVPLSDGYHILFTDPATGLLCLGSDAPRGGPTKLLRKIWFVGPQGEGSPIAYIAGSDLRRGVRVVAAYGKVGEQAVWLFSVPYDVFSESQAERGGTDFPFAGISPGTENGNRDWAKWWYDTGIFEALELTDSKQAKTVRGEKLWPVRIRGQKIGNCRELVDLAIDAGPMMTVWAFCRDGMAKTWQIDNEELHRRGKKKFLVMHDGTIREGDINGDVEMSDMPPSLPESLLSPMTPSQLNFDGAVSITAPGALLDQRYTSCQVRSGRNDIDYDTNGDVAMADLEDTCDMQLSGYDPDCSFDTVAMAQCGRDNDDGDVYYNEYLTRRSHIEQFAVSEEDTVDVLTGNSGIEIEIR